MIPPTATPQPAPATQGDVRLVYNGPVFTLYNNTTQAIDIAGLSFHSDSGEVTISRWDNGYLSTSLYVFPAGDCLMAWTLDAQQQAAPPDCGTRHSWIAVNNQQDFWNNAAAIEVRWYGATVTTCPGGDNTCFITLP